MKKLLILIAVFGGLAGRAQVVNISDTGALRTYINTFIINNNVRAITAQNFNNALNGFLNTLTNDSISIAQGTSNDTLWFWRRKVKKFYALLRVGSGGPGITNLSALHDVALTTLADGQLLKYNAATSSWVNFGIDKGFIGLGVVENTALSTWAGSNNINRVGTIANGIWNGSPIGDNFISSSGNWNAKQNAITMGSSSQYLKGDLSLGTFSPATVGLGNVLNLDQTNASNLTSGTIPAGRFGNATIGVAAINASGGGSTDFLRKDGTWSTPSGGSSAFSGLTDVTLSGIANNQLTRWNSTSSKWNNFTPGSSDVTGWLGYTPMNPTGTTSQYFRGNGSLATFPTDLSAFANGPGYLLGTVAPGSGGSGLASYTPYAILAAGTTSTGNYQQIGIGTTGQVLTSNGPGALPTMQNPPTSSSFNSLTDVAITSIANNQLTRWNNSTSKWNNFTPVASDVNGWLGYTPMNPTGTSSQYWKGNGTLGTFPSVVSFFLNDAAYLTGPDTVSLSNRIINKPFAYSGLTDVALTSIANGQLSRWNNSTSKWNNFMPSITEITAWAGYRPFGPSDTTSGTLVTSKTLKDSLGVNDTTQTRRPLYVIHQAGAPDTFAVKNDSAAWNAKAIQGVAVNAATPTDGQTLAYDAASSSYKPKTMSGGAGNTDLSVVSYPQGDSVKSSTGQGALIDTANGLHPGLLSLFNYQKLIHPLTFYNDSAAAGVDTLLHGDGDNVYEKGIVWGWGVKHSSTQKIIYTGNDSNIVAGIGRLGRVRDSLLAQLATKVSTFNGRGSGPVTPQTGDYTVSMVTGAAPLASPSFTGTITIPAVAAHDSTLKPAPTLYVDRAVASAIAALPANVITFNGRSTAVVPLAGDYTAAMVTNAVSTLGSYSNPSWLTSLAWAKIPDHPTSLATYGITDPVVTTAGSYANPSWLTALAFGKISGVNVSLTSQVNGILPLGNGGIGVGTISGYMKGNGTSPVTAVSSIPGSDITGNIPGNAANITGTIAESQLNLTDLTTANVTTARHGLVPKLPNDATKYLDGTGAYSIPIGTNIGSTDLTLSANRSLLGGNHTLSLGTVASNISAFTVYSSEINLAPGSGTVKVGHLESPPQSFPNSGAVLTSFGAGAGTGAVIAGSGILGSDLSGDVVMTTGSSPSANSLVANCTFGNVAPHGGAFPNGSTVILTPANSATADVKVYTVGSTTQWTINTGSTPLAASTTYRWHYLIAGF